MVAYVYDKLEHVETIEAGRKVPIFESESLWPAARDTRITASCMPLQKVSEHGVCLL